MDEKRNAFVCGAAVRDITPTAEMIPGLPRMGMSFGGVVDPLKVRAIALGSGEQRCLLLSFDLGGAPDPDINIPKIAEHTGFEQDSIFMIGTHAHATPMLGRSGPMGPMPVPEEFRETMEAYEEYAYAAMYEAIDEAIASMRPARYGYASGESYINVNRNMDYASYDEDGKRKTTCFLGFNGEVPTDRTLFTMRFEDYEGKTIAVFINYPVHCVVMHGNDCFDGKMGISGDIAGMVSGYFEEQFPGAVAMWTSGAAGDVNPIMMNQIYYPDPKSGEFRMKTMKGGNTDILMALSTRHYADILRTLDKIDRYEENGNILTTVDWSYTPGRDVIPLNPDNPMAGPFQVTINENTDPYDIRLQMLRLGDVALLGISGELYTSLALHLKEISPLKNTVIVTHCAVHMTRAGYIYDDDGIERDALHHGMSRILPGYVKDSLAKVMLDMFEKVR